MRVEELGTELVPEGVVVCVVSVDGVSVEGVSVGVLSVGAGGGIIKLAGSPSP